MSCTAYSGIGALPTSSSVNYEPGVIAPNMTVVPAGRQSSAIKTGFAIRNTSSGLVHMVVDRVGFYLRNGNDGFRFRPLATPTRILDTRYRQRAERPVRQGHPQRRRDERGDARVGLRRRQHHRRAADPPDLPHGVERRDGQAGREQPQRRAGPDPRGLDVRAACGRRSAGR